MRINVAKVGMELVDKLTGISYKITEVKASTEGSVTEAVATEIIPEEEEREASVVTVNAQNDITFKVTKWVEDTNIYNYTVRDGKLLNCSTGEEVSMGSIETIEILKAFPGEIMFTAKCENDDFVSIKSYMPMRDKFVDQARIANTELVTIEDSETRRIYGFNMRKDVESVDEQGNKNTKSVFDYAKLVVLTKGNVDVLTLGVAGDRSFDDDDDYDYDEEYVAPENMDGYDFTEAVMADGNKYLYIPVFDNANNLTYLIIRVTNVAQQSGQVVLPARLTAVTPNRSSASNLGRVIFSGKGYVKIDNVVIKSDQIDGYTYLVDARRNRETNTNTYILANKDRETKVITVVNTKDRGQVITVS